MSSTTGLRLIVILVTLTVVSFELVASTSLKRRNFKSSSLDHLSWRTNENARSLLRRIRRSGAVEYVTDAAAKAQEAAALAVVLDAITTRSRRENDVFDQCINHYQARHGSNKMLKAFRHCFLKFQVEST